MDGRGWVRGLTRTRQIVIPRRCMGAMPDTHVPQDRPPWCHWTAFKWMGCRLCLGGRLQVIPCGIAGVPPTKATYGGSDGHIIRTIELATFTKLASPRAASGCCAQEAGTPPAALARRRSARRDNLSALIYREVFLMMCTYI